MIANDNQTINGHKYFDMCCTQPAHVFLHGCYTSSQSLPVINAMNHAALNTLSKVTCYRYTAIWSPIL